MKRTLKEIRSRVKELIERKYNVVKWLDDSTALIHYCDKEHGDYYNAEDICILLEDM